MSEAGPTHLSLKVLPGSCVARTRRLQDLRRIEDALRAAQSLLQKFRRDRPQTTFKANGHLVTPADLATNELLQQILPRFDEGWLSEESADSTARLEKHRVWIVDPLDGTKEFQGGVPEWCVSIALTEGQDAVAGGICNPATGEGFWGSCETALQCFPGTRKADAAGPRARPIVLASRSEVERGEWDWLEGAPFEVRSVGSIAYKLALVAAGRADATWTLVPKHEWDIAAGVALVLASGGQVRRPSGKPIRFNQPEIQWEGLMAFSAAASPQAVRLFEHWLSLRA